MLLSPCQKGQTKMEATLTCNLIFNYNRYGHVLLSSQCMSFTLVVVVLAGWLLLNVMWIALAAGASSISLVGCFGSPLQTFPTRARPSGINLARPRHLL